MFGIFKELMFLHYFLQLFHEQTNKSGDILEKFFELAFKLFHDVEEKPIRSAKTDLLIQLILQLHIWCL